MSLGLSDSKALSLALRAFSPFSVCVSPIIYDVSVCLVDVCIPHWHGSSTESRVHLFCTQLTPQHHTVPSSREALHKCMLSPGGEEGLGTRAWARPTLAVPPIGWEARELQDVF